MSQYAEWTVSDRANLPLLTRTPRLNQGTVEDMRARIRAHFLSTYDRYEALFDCLRTDAAYFQKAISLRHPLIFYLGHTATFFVNKLLLTRLFTERINERFESMFAVGVDEMSWDDLDEQNYDWPTVEEVMAYRDQVRERILHVIEHAPLTLPIDWNNPWWAILMGIEHERIHLETSSVLIRQQKLDWVTPDPRWKPWEETGEAPENTLIPVSAGQVNLGKSWDDPIYGWDNEYGEHHAEVDAFHAAKYLTSNQEYLEFVEDGGYQEARYWSDEGWRWKTYAQRSYPEFWRRNDETWQLRLMTEVVPMPWDWPVETNFHEAEAFCRWKAEKTGKNIRLPTEDEWYRLYAVSGPHDVRPMSPWHANLHLDHGASSCPVNQFAHGEFYDVIGNVWQWTQTPTYPFDGFKVHPIYDDFTVPTFDDQHSLMKGGSWISAGNEAEVSSRYAFRRHFFQHAGFRYVCGELKRTAPSSRYETDALISQYAELHYGDAHLGVPNFSKALVSHIAPKLEGRNTRKALDLGCSVGRASFELSRYFDAVQGVDFSTRFIQLAVQLAQTGRIQYALTDEGELESFRTRTLKELNLDDVKAPEFIQGDACNLKTNLTGYDLILCANLIDRLYEPAKFLNDVHRRVNRGGLLVIATPYTWTEEHTPKEDWIGGFKKDGENVTGLQGLTQRLSPHFKMIDRPFELAFVIRETRRKFQHTLSEVTLWERNDVDL